MIEGKSGFPDLLEAEAFVLASEASYNDAVREAGRRILGNERFRMATLAGPSCSGKTTTANRLSAMFAKEGRDLHIISIDDFFYGRHEIQRRAKEMGEEPDYETVKAIDLDLFRSTVEAIRRGGEVKVPTFDFTLGERGAYRTFCADHDDFFLFEGIQAVYPEITSILGHSDCLSIFIEARSSLKIGSEIFLPPEIRFFRRLVRDYKFRASSPHFIFDIWENVRKNEVTNIYPYADESDVHIDSTMAYGINMLKPELQPILDSMKKDMEFGEKAIGLLDKIRDIQPIPSHLLPENSVFHEFLG